MKGLNVHSRLNGRASSGKSLTTSSSATSRGKAFAILTCRYFKVIANGAFLAYYNKKPQSFEMVKPNGVFETSRIANPRIGKDPKK